MKIQIYQTGKKITKNGWEHLKGDDGKYYSRRVGSSKWQQNTLNSGLLSVLNLFKPSVKLVSKPKFSEVTKSDNFLQKIINPDIYLYYTSDENPSFKNDIEKLQQYLWDNGFFKGIYSDVNKAVDGINGKNTLKALQRALDTGLYYWNNGKLSLKRDFDLAKKYLVSQTKEAKELLHNLAETAKDYASTIADIAKTVPDHPKERYKKALEMPEDEDPTFWDKVKHTAKTAAGTVGGAVTGTVADLGYIPIGIGGAINKYSQLWKGAGDATNGTKIDPYVDKAVNFIGDIVNNVGNKTILSGADLMSAMASIPGNEAYRTIYDTVTGGNAKAVAIEIAANASNPAKQSRLDNKDTSIHDARETKLVPQIKTGLLSPSAVKYIDEIVRTIAKEKNLNGITKSITIPLTSNLINKFNKKRNDGEIYGDNRDPSISKKIFGADDQFTYHVGATNIVFNPDGTYSLLDNIDFNSDLGLNYKLGGYGAVRKAMGLISATDLDATHYKHKVIHSGRWKDKD